MKLKPRDGTGCDACPAGRGTWRRRRAGMSWIPPLCLLPLLVLGAVINGCAGLSTSYEGTPARPDNRLALAAMDGKPQTWSAKDIAIHFTPSVGDDALQIDGTVEPLGSIKNFPTIKYLRASLHFIDAQGLILSSTGLWSAGAGAEVKLVRWTFAKRFPRPPGAVAIGFSYRGAVSDVGADGSGQDGWTVWQRP
ncbi:MAG: hypothetical protein PVJ53_09005 [Desulfobacterales bacterium]